MSVLVLVRRVARYPKIAAVSILPTLRGYCWKAKPEARAGWNTNHSNRGGFSPSFACHPWDGTCNVELVDDDTWKVSSGLALSWRQDLGAETPRDAPRVSQAEGVGNAIEDETDFDDIETMRVRGNLFYKLDRGSKEFEEYSFDFHRKGKSKRRDGDGLVSREKERSRPKTRDEEEEEEEGRGYGPGEEKLPRVVIGGKEYYSLPGGVMKKRLRNPTFNQLTGPYHEPFCLDIFVSKGSVRACVVHRATSKVVAVAHSISKDMKFDLRSTRNVDACRAVGQVLAERALADDIHDVVYTPRKGDRLEGKLQVVLLSIMDNGVNVKVKIKQRQQRGAVHRPIDVLNQG